MSITEHYKKEKRRFLENCIQCGLCAQECPILSYTERFEDGPSDIQAGVYAFPDKGALKDTGKRFYAIGVSLQKR